MHAAHAFLGVDGELVAVPAHAVGGAEIHDFLHDVELAPVAAGVGTSVGSEFAGHIGLHGFLVDLDVVLPGTDDGEVGAGHGSHAAVGAAVELELKLVGESGTMEFVLVVLGELVAGELGVVASVFAAGHAEAGSGSTQVGAGTTKVNVQVVGQFVEDFFELRSLGADEHEVTSGAVQVGHTGATEIPDVADAAQEFGAVVLTGRLSHTNGVEVSHAGELFGLVAVTADNAAAVTEHTDDTAVLPVGFLVFVGQFHDAKQVLSGVAGNLVVKTLSVLSAAFSKLLDVRNKAGPRTGFELVQQGSCMFRHCLTSTWLIMGLSPGQHFGSGKTPFRRGDP